MSTTKALVLSGGGFAGAAWMLGFIDALRDRGVDLGQADLIVGTSAGARTGAQLATGALSEVVEMHRRDAIPQHPMPVSLREFVAATTRIYAETPDRQEAARRIANLEPLGPRLVPEAERRRMAAAALPKQEWPDRRLLITAVDQESGRRVAFDAGSGVSLLDAVTASGALPGIIEPTTANGRRYVDGGVHSLYNADLAAGHDVVVVISPMAVNDQFKRQLDAEAAALGRAALHVIAADGESLAAIGPNPLSAETGRVALAAGAGQAERELDLLAAAWHGTDEGVRA